ncbi:MAG: cation-translocating P-type ATPase [Ardenticatenaceae bacterium]|nr:cation-translocating P-type ATPase [Ardenticatenaceae bacterium]
MVATLDLVECALCGLPTAHPFRGDGGGLFCCPACLEVDRLLLVGGPRRSGPVERGSNDVKAVALAADTPRTQATMVLSLGGLWCSSCAWLIGESLRRTPGVHDVDVSFVQREGRITFDPDRTDPRRLLGQVKRLGYRAWLSGEAPENEEERFSNRLLVAGLFAMHVMLISLMLYARDLLGAASPESEWLVTIFKAMMLLGTLPILALLGIPILRAGLASLLRGRPNTHTLVALGAFSAAALSVRNLLLGGDRVYFDTASMLLFLVTIGRWLEMRAQKSGSDALERLWKRVPEEATWITAEGERRVPADALPAGARVRVRPGERFPVDGLVATGEGDVDESLLTGEPVPTVRRPGERVLAGTVSLDGAFEIITTAVGAETVAGQIGRLLHQALWQRAPVERLADRLAALMVPAAVALAVGTFVFWTAHAGSETGLLNALAVLLIACPCALGLATPLTLWLALGRAAEGGVILRSTAALEHLAAVRQVFFDKTGTLTQPPFRLQACFPGELDEGEFLARIAAVEAASEHPLAQAVVAEARSQALTSPPATDFRAWPGYGVSARLEDATVWVGNERLMAAQEFALPAHLDAVAETWRKAGLCIVYAGWGGRVTGLLGLGEETRPEAVEVVDSLQAMGLQVAVLTGDDATAGERWQRQLGVPVYAEQRPEDKMARLRRAPGPVAMIGDGINDGPALAAATVGLAVGHGTDVARAAADAILLGEEIRAVPWLTALARAAMRRVRQNLAWAFGYNLLGLGLAVTGHLQPVLAAAAMVASSLIVTHNALRLHDFPTLPAPVGHETPEPGEATGAVEVAGSFPVAG